MTQSMVQSWLDTQCGSIPGIGGGLVMLFVPKDHALASTAVWPAGTAINPILEKAAKTAFERGQPLVNLSDANTNGRQTTVVSHPLRSGGETVGAFAITFQPDNSSDGGSVLRSMLAGIARFDSLLERRDPGRSGALGRVLELMGVALSHASFKDSATAVASQLATMLECDRVSIGFVKGRYVRIEALSQNADFEGNQILLRDIAAAMDECTDQAATIAFPPIPGDRPRITHAHAALSRQGNDSLCTIPLVKSNTVFGALCLEYSKTEAFNRERISLFENIASFVGPVLELKYQADLPLRQKVASHIAAKTKRVVGNDKILFYAAIAAVIAASAALAFIPTDYRLTAPARLEGVVQRALVAPADGYLKQALVRPGDTVKQDQVLATLAEEDLKLEQRKWQAEVAQAENSYGEALAKQNRAELVMAKAKIDEVQAQLALVQEKLLRTQIRAPFDGVIIKGDLTQSLSAPVKRGEVLMTLAPKDEYRVIVEVDERDIADVEPGQSGRLALAAAPEESVSIQVARVTPVADTVEGRHFFEVEAKLSSPSARMRPGLKGVAKLDVDQRSLMRIWTQRAVNWVRMTTWFWLG